MPNIQEIITGNFEMIFAVCIVWSIGVFAWLYWRRRQRNLFPEKAKGVIYQESFASGCSHKSWHTKLGGARNCLRLVITDTELWVTPFFPLSVFAGVFDLEHRILLTNISEITLGKTTFKKSIVISYLDSKDQSHRIEVIPRNFDKFNSILKRNG